MNIETPCVGICHVDRTSGLCRGCGRTLPEIARWSRLDSPERLSIMATLAQRMRDAGLPPLSQ
jgi:hypothetical protein